VSGRTRSRAIAEAKAGRRRRGPPVVKGFEELRKATSAGTPGTVCPLDADQQGKSAAGLGFYRHRGGPGPIEGIAAEN